MTTKTKVRRLHTTLGELITAITDTARNYTTSEQNAYRLTERVLNQMMFGLAPVAVTRRAAHTRRAARVPH